MTAEERRAYNAKRREAYRAAHPIVTDKSRKIIEAWERRQDLNYLARLQAEKDMAAEAARERRLQALRYTEEETERRERRRTIEGGRVTAAESFAKYEEEMRLNGLRKETEELATEISRLKDEWMQGRADIAEINSKQLRLRRIRRELAEKGTEKDRRRYEYEYNEILDEYGK